MGALGAVWRDVVDDVMGAWGVLSACTTGSARMTLPRVHALLANSREYQVLDPGAQLAFQMVWKPLAPEADRTYVAADGGPDAVDLALVDVRHRGQLLGPGSLEWLAGNLRGPLRRAGLVELDEAGGRVTRLRVGFTSRERERMARDAARDEALRELEQDGDAADPEAAKRRRLALKQKLKRARSKGIPPEQALQGYQYRGGTRTPGDGDTSPVVYPPVAGGTSPGTEGGTEEKKEEEADSSSTSSSPRNTEKIGDREHLKGGEGSAVAYPETYPPRRRVQLPPPPPPPAHEPYPLPTEQVMGILTGSSHGRIGDGTAILRAWLVFRLVELKVSEALLRRMAWLARGGTLHGQAKLLKEKGQKATGLLILAAPDGQPDVLSRWLDEARASLAAEAAAREKAQRNLGFPDNAREATSNHVGPPPAPVAPEPGMNPRLADKLTNMQARLAAPVRAEPPHTPPAAASGNDPPPK